MEFRFKDYLTLTKALKTLMKRYAASDEGDRGGGGGGITLNNDKNIQRTLWRNLDSVQGLLASMSEDKIALQETKFEVITSEVSYLKSLCILVTLFRDSSPLSESMSDAEKNTLFANIDEVRRCSEDFLHDLTGLLEKDATLDGIAQVACKHAASSFNPYVTYCSRQPAAVCTLNRLMNSNEKFKEALREAESSSFALGCTLQSYLMLPTQRITRLPLLFGTILQRVCRQSEEHAIMTEAFDALSKIASECNESVRAAEISKATEDVTHLKVSNSPVNKTYKLSEKTLRRLSKKRRTPSAIFSELIVA